MNYNILIAGVGGQGTLLASRILGNYAQLLKADCKLSEVHGMAQRGGSVVTYVKISDKVYSPVIAEGDADVLIAFEQLEALRWAYNVKKGGTVIVNTQKIMPLPVIIGNAEYPPEILETLKKGNFNLYDVDALAIATECGNSKAVNTVMIGKLAKIINLDYETLKKALTLSVPEKLKDINLLALEKSYNG